MSSVVVHYGELALKGRNRPWFINTLVRTIRRALQDLDVVDVRAMIGRVIVRLGPGASWEEVRDRLARLPGIGNFAHATRVAPDVEEIARAVVAALPGRTAKSFRITARRADKRFPVPTPDIERAIGSRVQAATGWPVDLSRPDLTIRIEVLSSDAYFSFERIPGAGGLPIGTSGKVMCLLSGGIDSPVAAYRMMRRGCSVMFVHFHSYPILSRASQEKVREIATLLTKYQQRSRLVMVAFGELQQQVVLAVPQELRVVVYRRLMLRIAERLARRWRARALVTGEVVGQVASQTLENLTTIAEASGLEILRPLVGMDKDEIADQAAAIGTLPISNIPDQDCCTLFTPRHPATRARLEDVVRAEQALPVDEMVASAVSAATVEDFQFPSLARP